MPLFRIRQPIRNLANVQAYLKTVPHGTKRAAIVGMTEYVIGDSGHGLKHDDPYSQTTRKKVYGQQWESDKQRRYVMAKIRSGEIVLGQRRNSPTKASQGYAYRTTNNGYAATIYNDEPGAYWSRAWNRWPRWRSVKKVIDDNIKGAMRHATAAVNKVLRTKGR